MERERKRLKDEVDALADQVQELAVVCAEIKATIRKVTDNVLSLCLKAEIDTAGL
jgi:hypothetical protein